MADTSSKGFQGGAQVGDPESSGQERKEQPAGCSERSEPGDWLPEPDVGRVANGIPRRVDRLRGLGNAIVPQVAEVIFRAIQEADKG